MTWLMAGHIFGIGYVLISLFWFCFFIYKRAFNFKRRANWLGALAAAFCWPIGMFMRPWK